MSGKFMIFMIVAFVSPLSVAQDTPAESTQTVDDLIWFSIADGHADIGKQTRKYFHCTTCHRNMYDRELLVDTGVTDMMLDTNEEHLQFPVSFTIPEQTTRTLLNIPGDSGLIVNAVCKAPNVTTFGLQANDVLLKVNGQPTSDANQFQELDKEDQIVLTVLRRGKIFEEKHEKPVEKSESRYLMGVRLAELEPVVQTQLGLNENARIVITEVHDSSAAQQAGIEVNDIVLAVNGKPALEAATIQEAVQQSKGKEVSLQLWRSGSEVTLEVQPRLVNPDPDSSTDSVHQKSPEGMGYGMMNDYVDLDLYIADTAMRVPMRYVNTVSTTPDLTDRLNEIDRQLQELKEMIRSLTAK